MMNNTLYLHTFVSLLPPYSRPQEEIVDWTLKAHLRSKELMGGEPLNQELMRRFCLKPNQIERRFYECDDINEDWEGHTVYRLMPDTPRGVDLLQRNLFFKEKATRVFSELYPTDESVPEHLMHVTCTGYISPSPPQIYFETKKRIPAITHAYHMGCYASLPAVRMGKALVKSGDFRTVDIVHTEMCGLHMDPGIHTPEQMVVQSLFADGHIKYRVEQRPNGKSYRIMAINEKLLPDSGADMTWIPSGLNMQMTLSKEVPNKIRGALPEFIEELCRSAEVTWSHIKSEGLFAIHPGGPKIIEATQRMLEIRDDQISYSHKVLKERGNMSSATLPHVWKEILDAKVPSGTLVLSLTFGPGLTIYGAIFEVVGE